MNLNGVAKHHKQLMQSTCIIQT